MVLLEFITSSTVFAKIQSPTVGQNNGTTSLQAEVRKGS